MIGISGKAAAIGRLIGWSAVAASFGFIGLQLWQHAPWQLAGTHLRALTAAVVLGALLYGLAGFLLSGAWHLLLSAGGPTVPIRWHHAVYGRTQIAKYLPGNVCHLVGRQIMGRRLGHGQAHLALASVLEVLLAVLVAAGLSLPLLLRWLDHALLWVLAFAGPAAALIVTQWLQRQCPGTSGLGGRGDRFFRRAIGRLLCAAALYTGFFLVVAAVFWALARSVKAPGAPTIDLVTGVSTVAFAWLVGFATPGSSAGIGVREAVLIAALEGTLGAPASGLIALALRLVSTAGDMLFFVLSVTLVRIHDWPDPIALGHDST